MEHDQIVKAIQHIRPGSQFVLHGDELQWNDEKVSPPTNKEIEEGWKGYLAKVEQDKIVAESKKSAALAKLELLGLDIDDLKALGLGQAL